MNTMNEEIKVGLDFGTHQTKICVQIIPDEGHGEPQYEFFKFRNNEGEDSYFLPSVIQINKDDTLSYGFADAQKRKGSAIKRPILDTKYLNNEGDFDIEKRTQALFDKYKEPGNSDNDKKIISLMLKQLKLKLESKRKNEEENSRRRYEQEIIDYEKHSNLFRYFKQAVFSILNWKKKIPAKTLCTWYLSYIIFLLENKYGDAFSINMGIPTDSEDYERKKRLAVSILATSYKLVEIVFQNNFEKFLETKVDKLKELTSDNFQAYSLELKEYYNINIFPEAYASLIGLTSKGKLSTGMSITADIGGGTTDLSFFTILNNKPVIYRFWSIPYGLNFIAEGLDFDDQDKMKLENQIVQAIEKYKDYIRKVVETLIQNLCDQFIMRRTGLSIGNLYDALRNRIIVYSGGGSMYPFLTVPVGYFTDVKVINSQIWKEENINDKQSVEPYCRLLATSYGLSISESDGEVKVAQFGSLFDTLPRQEKRETNMIDKDQV